MIVLRPRGGGNIYKTILIALGSILVPTRAVIMLMGHGMTALATSRWPAGSLGAAAAAMWAAWGKGGAEDAETDLKRAECERLNGRLLVNTWIDPV